MWHALLEADRAVGSHVAAAVASPLLQSLFLWASVIGRGGTVWLVLGLVAWFVTPAKRGAVWRLALSIGLSALLVDGTVKPIVDRARPFTGHPEAVVLDVRPDTSSFPSGHAATAAAGATALARVWPAGAIPFYGLALFIALSRVVVGVHFPIDVLCGLALGYAVARFVCARPPREDAPRAVLPAPARAN
jgi:undecaprenyl-diphosphatase